MRTTVFPASALYYPGLYRNSRTPSLAPVNQNRQMIIGSNAILFGGVLIFQVLMEK